MTINKVEPKPTLQGFGNRRNDLSVGVAVITYRARDLLPRCLPPLLESPLSPSVLVVNSSSGDGTVELAEAMGAQTLVVPRHEFNHGTTRELARKTLGTDIAVMMTPDAIPVDRHFLNQLVEPLRSDEAVHAAYARQIPHDGAGLLESFHRWFNYPEGSHVRSFADLERYGVYTFFCSNSCAAYRNESLDEVGGFDPVLTNEDYFAVEKLLFNGGKVAYVSEAIVKHSHDYTLWQEFSRNFDNGLVRGQRKTHRTFAMPAAERRGAAYVKALLREVWRQDKMLVPYALLTVAVKWIGFRTGYISKSMPRWWKRSLSSQDFYWNQQSG